MEILDQAARWMKQRDIRQRDTPPPLWRKMAREIGRGEVYIARLAGSGEPVGTLRFERRGRPLWLAEADAGYIHTMAIRPEHMGCGHDKAMLNWALDHIRGHGQPFLMAVSDDEDNREPITVVLNWPAGAKR